MSPFTEERPWGNFRHFTAQEPVTVKILNIKAGQAFSLQFHHKREEFWHVISGTPKITAGKKIVAAKPGDEFFIAKEAQHRIEAGNTDAHVLEISFGEFDENDIVRLKDNYGRA